MRLPKDPTTFDFRLYLNYATITADGRALSVRIRRGDWPSRMMQFFHRKLGAFVTGTIVHVPPGVKDEEVPWAHELGHAWQFVVAFNRSHVRYWFWTAVWRARYGYNSPLELQADRIADRWMKVQRLLHKLPYNEEKTQ